MVDVSWTPPRDDPRLITRASYYSALKPYVDYYRQQLDPSKPTGAEYEAVPMFVAAWKATGDDTYAELAVRATRAYCQTVDADTQDQLTKLDKQGRPIENVYWPTMYANLALGLHGLRGTTYGDQVRALLASSLGHRADVFPTYWHQGTYSGTIYAAHWYELALDLNPTLQHAAELRAFTDRVWNGWWSTRDLEDDNSHYSMADLLLLHSWSLLRGVEWWKDPAAANLWRHYCELITNDGSLPAYGDGGVHGYYFQALRFAELTASLTRDGRYKWLAHRAFWNGRGRLAELQANIGLTCAVELAFAYLFADDTVAEIPPQAGLTVPQRRFRERTDWNAPGSDGPFFVLHDWAPSKLVFRSGSTETDQVMVVQAASLADHGHPDCGNIMLYNGGWSFLLAFGASRLDYYMQHHNLVVLEDPAGSVPESAGYRLLQVSEGTSVPVSGSAPDASYARIHIAEYPGVTPTPADWQRIRSLKGGIPPSLAIGYKNWPARVDRSILFVNGRHALVRDLVAFTLDATARVGQNWTVKDIDSGPNWANSRIPILYGHPYETPPLAPVEGGDGELLIWMVPDGVSTFEVIHGPEHSWYPPPPKQGNYINLPNRVWSPRLGNWTAGQKLPFATVLVPHPPSTSPASVAASIRALRHDEAATVISIDSAGSTQVLAVNNARDAIDVGPFVMNAEAAVLTVVNGVPARLSAWQVTRVSRAGRVLLDISGPIDISTTD